MLSRSKIAALVAEFLGTAILATAVINISRSQIGIGYFVSIGVGLTLGLLALTFASISGAHFNPAITIGQWTIRKITTLRAIFYVAVQFLGGVVAWRLAEYFNGDTLRNLAGKSFEWKILVAEAVGTFVFAFLIAAAIYQGFKGLRLAAAVGGGLFLGVITATVASNGILNPAVALGAQSWGRGYIFGPIIGSIVAFNLYAILFAPESIWTRSSVGRRTKVVVVSGDDEEAAEAPRSSSVSRTAKKATRKPVSRTTRK